MKTPGSLIRTYLRHTGRRTIADNIFSLSVLQLLNYAFPLITLPYLMRTLGPERYGVVAIAASFIDYLIIVTDYGFNFSAVRLAAQSTTKKELSHLVISVSAVKGSLLVLVLAVLLVCIASFDFFRAESLLYVITFGNAVGSALVPVWFFRGIEKMRVLTILTFISKAAFTIGIFVWIRSADDYLTAAMISSTANVIVGCISVVLVLSYFKGEWSFPGRQDVFRQLKEGWHTFVANFVTSFYNSGNVFLVGALTNTVTAGYFASGEKIVRLIRSAVTPVSDALYPYVCRKYQESTEEGNRVIRKMFAILGALTMLLSLLTAVFADTIVRIVLGGSYADVAPMIRILAPIILLITMSNIAGVQAMLNLNYHREFMWILVTASGLHVILMMYIVPLLPRLGPALCVFVTESFVTISMLLFLRAKDKHIIGI